ncbi:hypothetical protein H2200_001490 [Cladophialophora chaetospira]|uniref:Xylanolytic transcriptional activator regulatory domain-containing protein n=1 Tax=Cladophialophora chaetospira TaxID=386627 RepID=A0AA39CPN7_9EURO|nr:hypothetical protein H2200_001490 [Cladophialophora chaetospira]
MQMISQAIRDAEFIWPVISVGPGSQGTYSEIRERLASLEELIRTTHQTSQARPNETDLAAASFSRTENFTQSNSLDQQVTSMPRALPLYLEDNPDTGGGDDESENPQIVGGMAMTVQERSVSAFFGPSSPTAFLRQINRMMLGNDARFPKIREALCQGSASVKLSGLTPKQHNITNSQDPFTLPPRVEMEVLIAEFFDDTGLLYPYIHEPTFKAEYRAMKASGFTRTRRTWFALLNVIFAMSVSSRPSRTMTVLKRDLDASIYYNRAVMLCGADMYQQTSLEMAQCLILMACYLQSTQDAVQTWSICGLAVKAAVSLGLHAHRDLRPGSDIEKEVGTRVWCGCLILERSLHNVLTDVMTTLYGENLGYEPTQSPKKFLAQIMALSEALEDWWDTVHPSIRWQQRLGQSPAEDERTPLDRFKNMLKIDFLSLQLLVYRPVILHAFAKGPLPEDETELVLSYKITSTFIQKCVECCKTIICIVHDTVTSEHANRGILYAPWFSLSYSFHAALVFFAAVVTVPWTLAEPREAYIPLFEKAIHTTELVEPGNQVMQASADYLRYLLTIMKSQADYPPHARTPNYWSSPRHSNEALQRSFPKESGVFLPTNSHGPGLAQSMPMANTVTPQWDTGTSAFGRNDFNFTQFLLPESFDFNL